MSEKSGNRKRGIYKKYLYSNLDEAIQPRTLKRRREANYFTPEQSRPSENLTVGLQPQQNDEHPEQNEENYEDNTNHGSEMDENDLQQAGPSTSNHTNFGQRVYNRPTQEEFQDFLLDDSDADDGGSSYNDSSDGEQDGETEENNGDNLFDAGILNEFEENNEGDVQLEQENNEIFSSGESDNEDIVKEIISDDDELNDDNVEMVNRIWYGQEKPRMDKNGERKGARKAIARRKLRECVSVREAHLESGCLCIASIGVGEQGAAGQLHGRSSISSPAVTREPESPGKLLLQASLFYSLSLSLSIRKEKWARSRQNRSKSVYNHAKQGVCEKRLASAAGKGSAQSELQCGEERLD
ncbi:hypothetical protein B566_EDAN016563 [Ephemera danica]|nr:hypothetical protein B566_EDAN016563 [Ephemera danica]